MYSFFYDSVYVITGFKEYHLPISVLKTNTRNSGIVSTCNAMSMYEITITKSFAK